MSRRPICTCILIALACASVLRAQEPPATPEAPPPADEASTPFDMMGRAADEMLNAMEPLVELFGTELPRTLAKYSMEISIDPKFRDFIDEDEVRVPIELRYGVSDQTEVYVEIEPYFPNWFDGGNNWGFSYVRFGAKNQLPISTPDFQVAVGFDSRYPLSFPPDDPSDGYFRIQPYIALERELGFVKDTSVFLNVGYEFVDYISGYNDPDDFIYDDDNLRFTAGVIHHRGLWNPFFRAQYRFEVADDPRQDSWFVEPGVLFDLPREMTHKLPGKWKVEAGLRYEVEDGDGEVQFNVRVKWRVRLRELGLNMGD